MNQVIKIYTSEKYPIIEYSEDLIQYWKESENCLKILNKHYTDTRSKFVNLKCDIQKFAWINFNMVLDHEECVRLIKLFVQYNSELF